jgi:hypothetical protein
MEKIRLEKQYIMEKNKVRFFDQNSINKQEIRKRG